MTEAHWLIIGTDKRMESCAKVLEKSFSLVTTCRTDEVTEELNSIIIQMKPTHIVLPVQGVSGQFQDSIFAPETTFFIGNLCNKQHEKLEQEGHSVQCYLTDERFIWNNARLTAEAFVSELYEDTAAPIGGETIYISGFGRVGRITSHVLEKLGATLTILARSEAQLGEAEALGYRAVYLLQDNIPSSGILINTIPTQWLFQHQGSTLRIFDLASQPGCLKPGSSSAYYTMHLGLPGKHFPQKAGSYLAQTIVRMYRGKE